MNSVVQEFSPVNKLTERIYWSHSQSDQVESNHCTQYNKWSS